MYWQHAECFDMHSAEGLFRCRDQGDSLYFVGETIIGAVAFHRK